MTISIVQTSLLIQSRFAIRSPYQLLVHVLVLVQATTEICSVQKISTEHTTINHSISKQYQAGEEHTTINQQTIPRSGIIYLRVERLQAGGEE